MPSRNTLKTAQNSIKRNFRRRNRYWEKTYNDLFDASAKARQGESWRLINEISWQERKVSSKVPAPRIGLKNGAATSVTYWGKCLL